MRAVTDLVNWAGPLFRPLKDLCGLTLFAVFLLLPHDAPRAQESAPPRTEVKTHVTVFRSKVVIARPVKEVWPIFLAMEDWMLNVRFQRVAGKAGEVGERRKVSGVAQKDDSFYWATRLRRSRTLRASSSQLAALPPGVKAQVSTGSGTHGKKTLRDTAPFAGIAPHLPTGHTL